MKNILVFSVCIFLFCLPIYAQEDPKEDRKENVKENLEVFLHPDKFYKKYLPGLEIKRIPLDTAYIKSYPNYLSAGIFVLSPALYSNISTRNSTPPGIDASVNFRTSVANIIGFSASYRFVSVGFALLLNHGLQKYQSYASSSYRTATIEYNNPVYSLRFRYLRLKGFTDINDSPIRKRPDILNKEFHFEGIYNFGWKRYSYMAPLTFSQRQVRSRAGFLLKGGFYYKLFSGDSALIASHDQSYYDEFADTGGIRTFSIKLAPGLGGNFVLRKRIYIGVAAFASADLYFYKYLEGLEISTTRRSLLFAVDGYASLGYQSERLYAGLKFIMDTGSARLQGIKTSTINTYAGLEFGYRFDAPGPLKKFYKKTMPPGM